jgi:NitT/TauT family transport system substrate-binding protein
MNWIGKPSVVVTVLGILAAACGPAPSTATTSSSGASSTPAVTSAAPSEKVNIRLAFKANGQHAPYYLGVVKGYYAAEGLELEVQEGNGDAQVIQTAVSGQDFVVAPTLDVLISARAQGAPVKAIAVMQGTTPAGIAVLSSSGITKVQDLAGKRLLGSAGASTATLLPAYLRAAGVDPASVTVSNVDSSAKVTGLLQKQAEGIVAFSNSELIAIQETDPGARFLFYGDQLAMYGIGLVASENTIRTRPDTLRRLLRATMKASVYSMEHPDEAVDAMFKLAPDTPGSKANHIARLKATAPLFVKANGEGCQGCMSDPTFQRMEDLLTQYGALPKRAAKMSDYYTNDLLK